MAYLTIPVVASGVGLVTNWMGVKMVFYPLEYTGVELYRSECSPFGLCRQLSMPWSLCPAMLCPPCCEKVLAQILLLRVPCLTVGWQGIVPARTEKMAKRLTMIVTSELMSLQEAFNGIDPGRFATLLTPTVLHAIRRDCEFGDWWAWALAPFLWPVLRSATVQLQASIEHVLDLEEVVLSGFVQDRSVLVELFQRVGKVELDFL